MEKLALFAFNGDSLCFIHVLLNAIDMKENGHDVKIIMEGSATRLIPEIAEQGNPLLPLYQKAKDQNLIDGACKACSSKMKVAEAVEKEGLPFLDEMSGHPSMRRYMDNCYRVIVF
jgi:hypothetical protein